MDYDMLASGVDDIREVVRVMVAGLMADGFSEEQARTIITGFFAEMTGKES